MIYTKKPDQFENPQEIVGCFVECQGKILLLLRQDHKEHGDSYGPPGGKVDKQDTSLANAMAREIMEETGLSTNPEKLKFIISFYVKYPDGRDFVYHQFRIIYDDFPEIKVHEKEHKGYVWVLPKEAITMPLIHDEEHCIKYVYEI
jgi:8-oxo-dGTP pyrophosphatase MutT (NUDIX family)